MATMVTNDRLLAAKDHTSMLLSSEIKAMCVEIIANRAFIRGTLDTIKASPCTCSLDDMKCLRCRHLQRDRNSKPRKESK